MPRDLTAIHHSKVEKRVTKAYAGGKAVTGVVRDADIDLHLTFCFRYSTRCAACFDQNCAIRNIDLTITRDQPAPQGWRIVDLNIRVH
jgi:hypothetical protein